MFDNADDPGLLAFCWPRRGNGCIVVTSRNRNICQGRPGNVKAFEIAGLADQQGEGLIFDRLGQTVRAAQNSRELCNKLSLRFDNWPLVLRQLSAYMNETHTDPQKMLDLLESTTDIDNPIYSFRDDSELYQDNLATAWSAFVHKPPGDSAKLLNILCLLDPDTIPNRLFYGDEILPRAGSEFLGSEFE